VIKNGTTKLALPLGLRAFVAEKIADFVMKDLCAYRFSGLESINEFTS
jgi:hypothetical protein